MIHIQFKSHSLKVAQITYSLKVTVTFPQSSFLRLLYIVAFPSSTSENIAGPLKQVWPSCLNGQLWQDLGFLKKLPRSGWLILGKRQGRKEPSRVNMADVPSNGYHCEVRLCEANFVWRCIVAMQLDSRPTSRPCWPIYWICRRTFGKTEVL